MVGPGLQKEGGYGRGGARRLSLGCAGAPGAGQRRSSLTARDHSGRYRDVDTAMTERDSDVRRIGGAAQQPRMAPTPPPSQPALADTQNQRFNQDLKSDLSSLGEKMNL